MNSSSARSVRVAIAEDDPAQRAMLSRLVAKLGYEVVFAAADGDELLQHYHHSDIDIDVVLMDLDMPEVDGLEAAERLAESNVPVVLVTGMPDAAHIVAENEPIVACLHKPIEVQRIQQTIELAAGSSNA